MKKLFSVIAAVLFAVCTFAADYTLSAPSTAGGWNSTVSGQTITITNWGGAGWWLDMDCSSYSKVQVNITAAAQDGYLDIYYGSDGSSASTRANISTGDTQVEAVFDADKKSSVTKIMLTCSSGSFTVSSAKLVDASSSGGSTSTDPIASGSHGFIVSGTKLLDAKNNPFRMLGTNLAYSWYTSQGYSGPLTQIAAAGANCCRIVLSNGKKYSYNDASTIAGIISKCEQLKLIAILEVHDATGSDNSSDLQDAAAYWVSMANTIKGHENTVIINIANEWMGTWNQDANYLSGYSTALATMRNAGISHCIMVDAPGYGQDVNTLQRKCVDILNADPNKNVMFSIHMYGSAGKPGTVESNINNVMAQNVCLVIGEYGWYHSDGDVDEDAIISHCESVGIGCLSWSWYGNSGGLEYLDMVSNCQDRTSCGTVYASGNSCNWGQKVMNSWKAQADTCTVYTNAPAAGGSAGDSTITLIAPDSACYTFTGWSNGETVNPYTITVTSDTVVTPIYTINRYTISTSATHGTVTGGGTYDCGEEVTLTATGDDCYPFTRWSDGNTDNPRTITVSADLSLTAEFGTGSGSHGFIVSGTQLLDAKNNPFRMLGTNLAYTWYTYYGYDTPLSQIAAAGANCCRIVLSNGKQYSYNDANTIAGIISKCEQLKLVAVLEVHDATGSDNSTDLQNAAAYWVSMANTINGHENTVIINIANEWMGTWDQGDAYLSAYSTAINTIRNAGINHCLMVDAPGYGQEVSTLRSKCVDILNADPNKNVMFSIHMYGTAGAPGTVESNINSVMAQNVCLVIGEYGWYHSDGDVDEDAIISHCESVGIGCLSWSWYGNGSPVEYLDMVSNCNDRTSCGTVYASGNSCNWGQKVMNSWAAQADTCTVYTNAPAAAINTNYTITTAATNGTVTGAGTYDCGEEVTLTATPDDCYQFVQWSDGNTDNPRIITVSADTNLTAEFTPAQITITVESEDETKGSVSVAKSNP